MSDKPEILTRTAMDVAREMLRQPGLFLEFDGTDGFSPPVAAVQRYTGQRAQEETVLKVGALRLLGASDRQIEQLCGVTRRSIPALLAQLEKQRLITPLKERLAQVIGSNAENASIVLRMLLERAEVEAPSVELAAMLKAVGTNVGILTEKFLLTTGQATEIIETRVGAGRDEFERWWNDQVRPIEATVTPAKDCESPASTPDPQQTGPVPAAGYVPDTSAPPSCPPPAAPGQAPGEGGGGGGGESPPGGKRDDSTAF